MYGAQTTPLVETPESVFENDVEMYGAQTKMKTEQIYSMFENDVEMYGAQTISSVNRSTK